ncbi:MAG: fibronectin type III-like domain-contianing protein [Burkholderiales bacterium]|nr:fibronectin type III-like domain-contianing protein [Roseateles sp.]MBV8468069.1 fibronectin type III-like domain-contianing protein [Burkholderiales bacterium]
MAFSERWHCRQSMPADAAHQSVAVTGRFRSSDRAHQRAGFHDFLNVRRDLAQLVRIGAAHPVRNREGRVALRGLQRVHLKAGERRELSYQLNARDLSFVDHDGVRQVMPGTYRLSVGGGQPDTEAPSESSTFALTRQVMLPR